MTISGGFADLPEPATNLTLQQEAGGFVLRWVGAPENSSVLYYTVEYKTDPDEDAPWYPLSENRIDRDEASYMSKIRILTFPEHVHDHQVLFFQLKTWLWPRP